MRRLWLLLLVLTAACGVRPTGVLDGGPPPVISPKSTSATVYLLLGGRLEPRRVAAASHAMDHVMAALFEAGGRNTEGLSTALAGLRWESSQMTRFGVVRNDPENADGFRLSLFISGGGQVTRTAMAQMTCTAMRQRQDIWAVKITHTEVGGPVSLGEHTCREFWDLAAEGRQLPR
ncbi:hypothetical protein Aph01nite_72410 [Acrocarpospora phusangensis]|uniref:Lipoprotein n=1 Tax=Acrocarpospora phusangensis TaxID=1070424 RepID=A0A919QHJ0_9ACTN|nr:hypothetical protein [Acrocarpospora phusangensis]GIH28931.1 hypothetical protein Aph01nite_72410 [Acrocarpospora phusangensis]